MRLAVILCLSANCLGLQDVALQDKKSSTAYGHYRMLIHTYVDLVFIAVPMLILHLLAGHSDMLFCKSCVRYNL